MNIKGEDSSSAGALNAFNENGTPSISLHHMVNCVSSGMRVSFPYVCTPVEIASANVYYFSKDSPNLVSLISGDLSLKKTNEQFLAVERFVAVNEIQPFANISTGDVIISLRLQDLALLTSSYLLRTLKLRKMMTS
ncbi:hypothetical protein F511_26385 [Dorcoceras hygrometricum]|uniref:Uncharacterized protein n=1 Tax=Dorcoceras hygrometricum TaxID=472368 RepID=A0A2Z7D8Z6_9LAMI|nr:hypothetical protein F511_26385 [Dorcoceras hygrometricum]